MGSGSGAKRACHIHIVVSGITLNLIRDVWIYGGMYIEPLRKDRNYRQLAEYFVKYSEKTRQTYGGKQAGRYNPSRNLTHVKIERRRRRKKTFAADEIKVPEGWYLDKGSVQEWINDQGYKYLYYILVQIEGAGTMQDVNIYIAGTIHGPAKKQEDISISWNASGTDRRLRWKNQHGWRKPQRTSWHLLLLGSPWTAQLPLQPSGSTQTASTSSMP